MQKTKHKIYSVKEHNINVQDIDLDAIKIINRLQRNGFQAYLVGGGVRDLLLNKKPKDFDIATDATPNQIKKLFNNCRIIGKRFKLAHLYFRNKKTIEVSTFRETIEEIDLNSKDNMYGTIETDALRRDLTINALFYDPTTEDIHDFVNGFSDIQKRIIRVIGNAESRYNEDPVRIIRTLRHLARTGFKLHADAKKGISLCKAKIADCPSMRIYEEFKKDLTSGYFQEIFLLLREYKILYLFLPELTTAIDSEKINRLDLISCFKGIDRAALETKLDSPTAPLAILTLYMIPEYDISQSLKNYFRTQQEVNEFGSSIFKSLSVPRKIKAEIVSIIKMIWSLDKSYATGRKFKLSFPTLRTELKLVLNFININQNKSHLNKIFRF